MLKEIKVKDIILDEIFNSRDEIQFNSVIDLARSIEKTGLIQPIVVREIPDGKYKLIAGHRRTKAHLVLCNNNSKFDLIQAMIRNDLDEKQERLMNLNENLARRDLNIVEEAKALLPLFTLGMTEQEIVDEIPSASRGWVQIRLMLLKLPKEIQEEMGAGLITQTHIRELYTMKHAGLNDEALFEEAKKAKNAKARGDKYRITVIKKKDKTPSETKHIRSRSEIFIMIKHMCNNDLDGLSTRILSWASGEITDLDIFLDFKDENPDYVINKNGINYSEKL